MCIKKGEVHAKCEQCNKVNIVRGGHISLTLQKSHNTRCRGCLIKKEGSIPKEWHIITLLVNTKSEISTSNLW